MIDTNYDHLCLIDTCFHEAGHSIIGLLQYMRIDQTLVNADFSGWTASTRLLEGASLDSFSNNFITNSWIYFNYGGLMADRHYFTSNTGSKKYPNLIKIGSALDVKIISDFIAKNNLASPGAERSALKQKMMRETAQMVKQYWEDIVLLSHALFNKTSHLLTYDDIKIILTQVSSNKSFWKKRIKSIDYLMTLSSQELSEINLKSYLIH